MRSLDEKMLLKTVFQSEAALIPRWLRISKFKLILAFITETMLISSILYILNFGTATESESYVSLCLLVPLSVLIPLWFYKAQQEQIKAYATATRIVSAKIRNEKNRFARNSEASADLLQSPVPVIYREARFCPSCGFLMNPADKVCKTCGTFKIYQFDKDDITSENNLKVS